MPLPCSGSGLSPLATGILGAADLAPSSSGGALLLGGAALAVGLVALVLALRARRVAEAAAEEAGQARARAAQTGTGGVTPEALAAVERLWSTRLAALESQVQGSTARPAPRAAAHPAASELGPRLEALERTVAGFDAKVAELRRADSAPARDRSAEPAGADSVSWPALLAVDTPAMRAVRQALGAAATGGHPALLDLFSRLRTAEGWPAAKLGASELAEQLQEISSVLLAVLRHDGTQGPLDAALLADRVLATLRPTWKSFQPHLDCRTILPGLTFDPDWMEDRTATGLRRPVISEALSWAVFEKLDAGRRVFAKARVITE